MITKDAPTTEIEITPEMVRAGADLIDSFDRRVTDASELAEWVYEAMERVRRKARSLSA